MKQARAKADRDQLSETGKGVVKEHFKYSVLNVGDPDNLVRNKPLEKSKYCRGFAVDLLNSIENSNHTVNEEVFSYRNIFTKPHIIDNKSGTLHFFHIPYTIDTFGLSVEDMLSSKWYGDTLTQAETALVIMNQMGSDFKRVCIHEAFIDTPHHLAEPVYEDSLYQKPVYEWRLHVLNQEVDYKKRLNTVCIDYTDEQLKELKDGIDETLGKIDEYVQSLQLSSKVGS